MGKEYKDTIQPSGVANVVDLLCEGEIKGLVDGEKSIFLDGAPLENDNGTSDFTATKNAFDEVEHFRAGLDGDNQTVLPEPFDNIRIPLGLPRSTKLTKSKAVVTTFNTNSYPNVTEVSVNIRFKALFRNWDQDALDSPAANYKDSRTVSRYKSLAKSHEVGDISKGIVHFKIYLQHNDGVYKQILDRVVEQKSSGGFISNYRFTPPIDNSKDVQYYKIKVVRLTEDPSEFKS